MNMSDKIERIIDALRKKILESAIRGKLVLQNPEDEPASKLLERIAEERERLIKEKKIKKPKSTSRIFRRDGHFYESINGGEPTCIDDDIPFEIPDSWEWVRARSIVSVERGGSPRPIKAYITESEDGINWIKIGDSRIGSKYISSTKEKIKPEGVKRSRTVNVGDLLLSNSMSFGRAYILKTNGCIHDGWLVLHPYLDNLNREYLYYLFASTTLANQFKKLAKGSTVSNLNEARVSTVLIPLPPILEEKAIVSAIEQRFRRLDTILEARVRYSRILSETPTSLRQQLIQAAIQGQLVPQNPNDEPASALLERIAQERSAKLGKKAAKSMSRIERRGSKTHSTYHEIFADGSEKEISEKIPFCIPDNWQWTRLGTIADVKGGKRIPSGMHTTSEKTAHIYIRVADMIKGSISDNNLVYISDNVFQKIARYTISKDDLYLTIAGTIGKAGIVPDIFDGMNLTENAVKITNFSINKQFLLFLLISECCRSQFAAKTTCVAQPKLAIERILTTLLPIPPLKEQEKVCKTLQKCLELVDRG